MPRKWLHLVIDLDGVLVDNEGDTPIFRPCTKNFLDVAFRVCASVSLWTASSEAWLLTVQRQLIAHEYIPLGAVFRHSWYGNRCSLVADRERLLCGDCYAPPTAVKRLRKFWKRASERCETDGMTKHSTLIVDDTPRTYRENYGNAIPIPTWVHTTPDATKDDSFVHIAEWIEHVSAKTTPHQLVSVRNINKRYWHCHSPNI